MTAFRLRQSACHQEIKLGSHLVKVLLKKRNKLQIKNPDSANEISKRIAQLIKENRKALTTRKTGSGM